MKRNILKITFMFIFLLSFYQFSSAVTPTEFKITASDGAELDYFGSNVSINGNRCIVGAHGDDDNGSWSGSAYIFQFNGLNWTEEQKLTASDGETIVTGEVSGRVHFLRLEGMEI